MAGKTLLLWLLLFLATDAKEKSRPFRKPFCGDMTVAQACPLNYAPVCGTDGITYANECALCVRRLETNANILIVKEGQC